MKLHFNNGGIFAIAVQLIALVVLFILAALAADKLR
jgi:hypothetical protein